MPRFIKKILEKTRSFKPSLVSLNQQQQSAILVQDMQKSKFAYRYALINQNYNNLIRNAQQLGCYSLSSNQINCYERMFIMSKQQLNQQKWIDSSYQQSTYSCIINPKVLQVRNLVYKQQQCVSLPFIIGNIARYEHIVVQYSTENAQIVHQQLQGTLARIFQHNVDHLQGRILLDWRVNHGEIFLQKDMMEHFPKSGKYLNQYSTELKTTFKKYPSMIQLPYENYNQQQDKYINHKELISFQSDYIYRIAKAFRKQMLLVMQRINLGHFNN